MRGFMRGFIQLFGQVLAPAARRFAQALDNPQVAQQRVQQDICQRLIASEYGQTLGIRTIADWNQVPIVDYDTLTPWIVESAGKQPQSPHSRLTPEPILLYEKTSGSSGPVKWIPYTRSLRRSFHQMFCVWAHDLIQHGPRFSTGKLYVCLSPQFGSQDLDAKTDSRLQNPPQNNDADYLDGWLQWLLRPFLVTPAALPPLPTPEFFQQQLGLSLLQAECLETISIWSPSFLTVQLDYIQANRQFFRDALRQRLVSDRLQLLTAPEIPWTQLWPALKLISCWDRVNAADQAQGLRSQFPGVLVQGKGLLSTEAPMTIPLIAAQGYVPVLDEVFFEFADDRGQLFRLSELSVGQEYTIILSQKGGLYRYRIGDRVRVTHLYRNTPCLEFLGRSGVISDLVGEKLNEAFVQTVLLSLELEATAFRSLVPVAHPPHYLLLLDHAQRPAAAIAQQLDTALSQSYHYRQARGLGQLAPPQVLISPHLPEVLARDRRAAGSAWGGIKHPLLATVPIAAPLLNELQSIGVCPSIYSELPKFWLNLPVPGQ